MFENRQTWWSPRESQSSIRASAHPTFVRWRSPCGLFESVRAAPSACESRSAIFAPGRNESGGGGDRRAIPSGTRACPHDAGPRDRLRLWFSVMTRGPSCTWSCSMEVWLSPRSPRRRVGLRCRRGRCDGEANGDDPRLLSLSRGQLACSFIFVNNSCSTCRFTFVTIS